MGGIRESDEQLWIRWFDLAIGVSEYQSSVDDAARIADMKLRELLKRRTAAPAPKEG